MVFSEVGNGSVFLWMFEFFMFVIWFWLLLTIFSDLFRDHEMSGGMKAVWCIFVIILPFLGIFVYLIARGGGMAGHAAAAQKQMQSQMDDYVRQTAGTGSAADQIAKAKELLDAGTIDQAEFDSLKAKALA